MDKERRQPTKMAKAGRPAKVEVGGVWSIPDEQHEAESTLQAAHFYVAVPAKPLALAAAPGVE
jgi:hypothetical protein